MRINNDVEAVITSYNQKTMIYEAVHSLCCQSIRPGKIIIVDDGSTDEDSVTVLNEIEAESKIPIPLQVIRQPNRGVSAARNAGIFATQAPLVLVLDGDDSLKPSFIEEVCRILNDNPSMIAASSWLYGWEREMIHAKLWGESLDDLSGEFLESPSYGDGGMASAVRIVSAD